MARGRVLVDGGVASHLPAALFQPQGKVRPRPGPSGGGLSVAAPYKLHGGNSTTRSLHAWDECTKREYAKDVPCEPTRSTCVTALEKLCGDHVWRAIGWRTIAVLEQHRLTPPGPAAACATRQLQCPPLTLSSLAGLTSTRACRPRRRRGPAFRHTALALKTTVPRGKSKRSTFVHIEGTWAERRLGSETLPKRGAAGGGSTSQFVFFTSHSNLAAILAWYSAVPRYRDISNMAEYSYW